MVKGQIVNAKLYGGATAARRVVLDKGDVVVICSEAEYQAAEKEGREPSGIGFPRQDIVELSAKKSTLPNVAQKPERARAGD